MSRSNSVPSGADERADRQVEIDVAAVDLALADLAEARHGRSGRG